MLVQIFHQGPYINYNNQLMIVSNSTKLLSGIHRVLSPEARHFVSWKKTLHNSYTLLQRIKSFDFFIIYTKLSFNALTLARVLGSLMIFIHRCINSSCSFLFHSGLNCNRTILSIYSDVISISNLTILIPLKKKKKKWMNSENV